MYIFSESMLSSLELFLCPYMKIVQSRRASKLRRCYYALGLYYYSFDMLHLVNKQPSMADVDTAT